MIRLGTIKDLPTILTIVEEAKSIMQQENNNQWDEQYPLKSHFKEDISKDSLFVLEEKDMELNYEINGLIEIYTKYRKMNIKNININISIEKKDDLLAH